MNPIYIFIHLAKTGGTTFLGNLYKHMSFDTDFIDLGLHGNRFRLENNRKPLEERTQKELDQIKIVTGHLVYWDIVNLFPSREPRFVIFLREPISRVISHFTFDTSITSTANLTFTEWYKTWIHNQTYAFLCDHLRESTMRGVLEKLKLFWHIGIKENLDPSLEQLYKELNIPTSYINRRVSGELENSTKDLGFDGARAIRQTYIPTPDELALVKETHKKDSWLYEHIKESLVGNRYKPEKIEIPSEFA